jgi:hypothetical protein
MNVEGDGSSTATSGRTILFEISDVDAEGASSGVITMAAGEGDDAGEYDVATASKTGTIMGSVLTSVVNQLADGQLVGGANKVLAKYTLTFDNGSNRNTDEVLVY